mmetsp:Transcript_6609/g.17785  ORF Transcript_6609/g.17785 Transcript_6609/m.17785 type:complete len:130 (+) Transcript_6609:488-877(+)
MRTALMRITRAAVAGKAGARSVRRNGLRVTRLRGPMSKHSLGGTWRMPKMSGDADANEVSGRHRHAACQSCVCFIEQDFIAAPPGAAERECVSQLAALETARTAIRWREITRLVIRCAQKSVPDDNAAN